MYENVRAYFILRYMPKQHTGFKSRDFLIRGAVSQRIVVTVAAVLLSLCASVSTFWLMTKIEERFLGGNARNAAVSEDTAAPDEYEYDETPIDIEINISETPVDISTETRSAPARQNFRDDMDTPTPTRPASYYISSSPGQRTLPNGFPYSVENASAEINYFAMTFDGGSYAAAADEILDTLASRNVRSTIFVTGAFIRRFPQIIIRAAEMGHEIGNHTLSHPRLTTYADNMTQSTRAGVSRQTVTSELEGAARILADRTGLRFVPLWRAPYGEYNRDICRWALDAGYLHIGWRLGKSWHQNLDSNDWVADENSTAYRTPEEVFNKIVRIASHPGGLNGGIILFHLGTERKQRSQQVHIILGRLIDTLRDMGYEPVTVSELLYRSNIDLNAIASLGDDDGATQEEY